MLNNNDNVNHPMHYETGKFECIEVMLETQGKKRYRTSAFATPSNTFTGIRTRTVMKILQKQSGT